MKTKRFYFAALVIALSFLSVRVSAQNVRSYARAETTAQTSMGAVTEYPTSRMSMTVTWNGDGTLHLMDGSNWEPTGSLYDGTIRYKYTGHTGMQPMPNTSYKTLLMAPDYSVMVVNYVFGMPGMYSEMSTRYTFLGEGAQAAYDYSSGGSTGGFNGGFDPYGGFGGSFGGLGF